MLGLPQRGHDARAAVEVRQLPRAERVAHAEREAAAGRVGDAAWQQVALEVDVGVALAGRGRAARGGRGGRGAGPRLGRAGGRRGRAPRAIRACEGKRQGADVALGSRWPNT